MSPPARPPTPRRRRAAMLALAAALGLAGCADRPPAASFVAWPQKKLQSARHWDVIAGDVAAAVSTYLEEQAGKKEPVQVYFMRDDGTLFADAFQQALITAFVKEGNPVAVDARPDAVSVGIDVTLVPHSPDRPNRTVPGALTALGLGVWVGSVLLDHFPWGAGAGWFGFGADAMNATVNESATELVMTVSLAKNGFYVFRSSAVYYINDRELAQYAGHGAGFATFNDVPPGQIGYDLGGAPYVIRPAVGAANRASMQMNALGGMAAQTGTDLGARIESQIGSAVRGDIGR